MAIPIEKPRSIEQRGAISPWLALSGLLTLVTMPAAALDDAERDWQTRSQAPGVFYADNFAGLEDDEALRERSFLRHRRNPTRLFLETRNTLSGGGAVRIEVNPEDGEGTATYAHSFDGIGARTKTTRKKELYYQFSIYMPKYILDHRFKTVNDKGDVGHKWAILQEPDQSFGKGEIVVKSTRFSHVVSAYTVGPKGTHGFGRKWPSKSGNPCSKSPDYQWQATVDGDRKPRAARPTPRTAISSGGATACSTRTTSATRCATARERWANRAIRSPRAPATASCGSRMPGT